MGSENDMKRLDVEVDRLSSLPDDLIHKILSLNGTLDAVKTSILSPRWRFIWTTMTSLAFSSADFPNLPKFANFVKHVLSGRNDEREVSSVKLSFRGKAGQLFVKKIVEYAFSHNVQQLEILCLADGGIEFPLSLFSSQTLKHLVLKKPYIDWVCNEDPSVTLTSTWEVPAVTSLHLEKITLSQYNTDNFSGLISNCVNLKYLTLTSCHMAGSNNGFNFSIHHSKLSNITIDDVAVYLRSLSVVAPQLKNLTIRRCSSRIMIYAPDLACLLLECLTCSKVSADNFHSLEKADISFDQPQYENPQSIIGLIQLLRSVKDLTLNLEIIEHLSSFVDIVSHQPSPLANLESLKIYPKWLEKWRLPEQIVNMSTEVKNYLLDGSPGATFTMVSREEVIAEANATHAKERMGKLQVRLEQEKSEIETKWPYIMQGKKWAYIMQGKKKIDDIVRELRDIEKLMIKPPASNRAKIQLCFSSLCAQADIVKSKITDCMKIQSDENQSRSNV